MISLILLGLTLILGSIITRISSIALEITGMDSDQASFQALSAFSGAGFTTRESEFAVNHPQRRKIIKNLMRMGKAGIITTVATSVGALVASPQIIHTVSRLDEAGVNEALLYCSVILLLLCLVEKFLSSPAVGRLIKEYVTQVLIQSHVVDSVQYKELYIGSNGFSIIQVDVCERNPLLNKTLEDARLSDKEIKILNVDRIDESIKSPSSSFQVHLGDRLLCYGPLNYLLKDCCAKPAHHQSTAQELTDEPLAVGAQAPVFSLEDETGKPLNLEDYLGKKHIILLFYPRDKTFTCSSQLRKFSQNVDVLADIDAMVIAINPQSSKSHANFAHDIHARFPILSDTQRTVCKAYKALMFGGLLVNRTVYVIDKNGRISYAERGNPNVIDVIKSLRQLPSVPILQDAEACAI